MPIKVESLSKSLRDPSTQKPVLILDSIDLDVAAGEIVGIFGPNGSGKTTLLDIIATLLAPDSGTALLESDSSDRPLVSYSLQAFREALLPWDSAVGNVAFPFQAAGMSRQRALESARRFLQAYPFPFPHGNYPYQLSVGQQQMVSLARSLAMSPCNLLLDEPFSALDHHVRYLMQDRIRSVIERKSIATVLVSHDIDELLYMSDCVVLFSRLPGKILKTVAVEFPRPRSHAILVSSAFSSLRKEVLSLFLSEVGAI